MCDFESVPNGLCPRRCCCSSASHKCVEAVLPPQSSNQRKTGAPAANEPGLSFLSIDNTRQKGWSDASHQRKSTEPLLRD
jgi:hypothetical protein